MVSPTNPNEAEDAEREKLRAQILNLKRHSCNDMLILGECSGCEEETRLLMNMFDTSLEAQKQKWLKEVEERPTHDLERRVALDTNTPIVSEIRSPEYEKGYNSGYIAGRRAALRGQSNG